MILNTNILFNNRSQGILILCLCCLCYSFQSPEKETEHFNRAQTTKQVSKAGKVPEIIVIHHPEIPPAEKEAILILPGFGDSKKARKNQKRFFGDMGYDLFIPDYFDKSSFQATVAKFTQFYDQQKLASYKKVHVFSYIMGSWVINSFILKEGSKNISTIVYDRSPLQERAPQVVVDRLPRIGKMMAGPLLADFSKIPYPSIPQGEINIGIIVESKATKLIRIFRKQTMSYGPIDWHNLDFQQPHDDLMYTRLNHAQMYKTFDEIGADILHFIEQGSFTSTARRAPFDWNVFKKYKK